MDRTHEALTVILSLVGLSLIIWLILFFVTPSISPKRKVYILFMLLVTAVSSFFSFYLLLPLPLYIYCTSTVYIYWACYIKPGLRPLWFRIIFSWPASIYQGVCIFMLPFLWVPWLYWKWLALVVTGIIILGFIQSFMLREEHVYIKLTKDDPTSNICRYHANTYPIPGTESHRKSIRIAQITDPHVGVHMSPERLYNICCTIASWNPDLVFVTGDILTVESYFEVEKLTRAFSPLSQMNGKVYACLGNHDYESMQTVTECLSRNNIMLLKDQDVVVDTALGPIQLIGTEFTWSYGRTKIERIIELADHFQEKKAPIQIWLTHNPDEFLYFPNDSVDIMFSGHTHGGQIGLQSLGINFTFMNMLKRSPDFGLWKKGNNLLYVHRGTGYQGFPVRLGVSNELSLVTLYHD